MWHPSILHEKFVRSAFDAETTEIRCTRCIRPKHPGLG